MNFDEIIQDILKQEDIQLYEAFISTISTLLISNDIQPMIFRTNDESISLDNGIITRKRNVIFELDMSEHDRKIHNRAIKEFQEALHSKYENNKKISEELSEVLDSSFPNLNLEEIDTIAEYWKIKPFICYRTGADDNEQND